MAILGLQLVFSMITASCLSKLGQHYSFARWILCGRLVRYLYPTEYELKKLAGPPPHVGGKSKGRKHDHKKDKNETFTFPKSLDVQLESEQLKAIDVMPLRFFTEYQWLVDFSLCGSVIYLATELYYAILQPRAEFNLSMMWCLLAVGFSLKVLYSITAIYFRTEEGGEKIMCIVFLFFFLVMSMGFLIVDDSILEFGLEEGYYEFSSGSRDFLEVQGIDSVGPVSLLSFRIVLAVFSAIIGAFLTFPGLRLAKMHTDTMKYAKNRPWLQIGLHINMVFPLFIALMWLKPFVRQYLVKAQTRGINLVLNDEMFDAIRIVIIVIFCMFRFCLIVPHLQSHLNLAFDKVERMKKEAGRISAVDLQKMVAQVFYYLCVVALQYAAPIILLLYCTFMLKTMGDYSLTEPFGIRLPSLGNSSSAPVFQANDVDTTGKAAQFSLALSELRQVFTPKCFRGLFSYLCWWICSSWFMSSAFGLMYYSYFESS